MLEDLFFYGLISAVGLVGFIIFVFVMRYLNTRNVYYSGYNPSKIYHNDEVEREEEEFKKNEKVLNAQYEMGEYIRSLNASSEVKEIRGNLHDELVKSKNLVILHEISKPDVVKEDMFSSSIRNKEEWDRKVREHIEQLERAN